MMPQCGKTRPWEHVCRTAFAVLFPEDCVIEPQFSFLSSSAMARSSLRRASALDFW